MGIFDFFKRKDKKCIECGSLIVGNQKICSSCTPEAKIAAAKAKKRSAEKFKELKDVNLKITEIYQAFKKKIKETDDGRGASLKYWYDIVKNMASQYPLEEDSSFDLQIKEFVYGNYDEYKKRDDLIDATDEELETFARMRIFSFGEVYSQLMLLEKKINKLLSDNSIKKHKISVQLNNELARAKARTYGAIKYALSVNISKNKIKEWFPAFVDDKELIEGVNPWDSLAEKYNIDLPSSTPQYELSEEEKNNIPDWYNGPVDDEGSVIKDDKTGKEIKLTGLESSIYNVTKMNNILLGNMQEDLESGKADKIILESPIIHGVMEQLEQGKLWLKENNLEVYKLLFKDLDGNIESFNKKTEVSHHQIASDYEESGEYKLAIEHYTKSIETDPNDVYSYFNRGRIYDEVTDQLQLAVDDYTKAISIDPNDAETHYNRGIVFTKLKRYDDGVKDFTKAIEIDPNYASAYKNRGIAKQQAGMEAILFSSSSPCSDWKKACSLGIEECCIWYEEDNCG
jgi:tetratricopeptide (TPR) repeat protein